MMGFGMGFGLLGFIFILFVGGILIAGAVLLIRALFPAVSSGSASSSSADGAREILDQRYARGEITRDEYEGVRKDLGS
jgi:putative membrane protein